MDAAILFKHLIFNLQKLTYHLLLKKSLDGGNCIIQCNQHKKNVMSIDTN